SGRNPDDVKRRRKAEVDDNRELGLVYDTDPANDKGGTSAEVKEPDAPSSESQRKK
ncbi:phage portal protein, partial [Klebsiella pneumoniae]|nr:phage portal protein [Klebsiella pneumoniae]